MRLPPPARRPQRHAAWPSAREISCRNWASGARRPAVMAAAVLRVPVAVRVVAEAEAVVAEAVVQVTGPVATARPLHMRRSMPI